VSVGLLDVNMLIALTWPSHIHHHAAQVWFAEHQALGWATCPLTQCGFVRVSSNPRIIPEAVEPAEAVALMEQIVTQMHHEFWPDEIAFSDQSVPKDLLVGHRQVTDAYLLGLSIHRNGRLVTLDQSVAALLSAESPHAKALVTVPV